ncbi:Gly-Xaa carboxypeptidase [Stylosanthes scabra]|uniref:Gly-Xaa carboxypeptidase n=1 Tax=Stylosanthes scabra TaxID=79078 RepID=A0ABU6YDB2_9FABA|nr:Gly-Xaa carboxypeptidase [Stylosanthes scabra]
MEDGETSVSGYDTAWVGMVKDVNGGNGPQFPSCLEWIANNQLPDGSWGYAPLFLAYDRLLNTLACVVALTAWDLHTQKCHKGYHELGSCMLCTTPLSGPCYIKGAWQAHVREDGEL